MTEAGVSLPTQPLLDSADGIIIETYVDSLYDESEDFNHPCEIEHQPRRYDATCAGTRRRAVRQVWGRKYSSAQGLRLASLRRARAAL